MAKSKYDPSVYVAMREQGMTNYDIARTLGNVNEASVRRGLEKAGYKPYLIPTHVQAKLSIRLEKPVTLNTLRDGGGAVTADWHLPLTNWGLINTFIDHARDVGATNWLVAAGDIFNMDALSDFDFKQEQGGGLPDEVFAGNRVIGTMLETFDRIIISWGNHDARIHKALRYKVDFATAMKMMLHELSEEQMSRIEFSNLDHVYVETPNGDYRINHPKQYSATPLTQARKMASKYLCHVLNGHSHHSALGYDVSGKYICGELGGFIDPTKTQYLQRSTSFTEWQPGYSFIDRAGFLTMESAGWSSRIGASV